MAKRQKKVLDAPGVVSVFPGVCRVKVDALNVCHPALLPYIFREMILHVRKTEVTDIFGVHLEKLGELVTKQSGKRLDLPLGLLAYREFDDLVIAEKTADDTSGLSISNTTLQTEEFFASADFLEKNYERITHLVYTKWVDCDKIKGTLKLRTRQPGDVLKINDGKNTKKLQDYFVEAKIPATFRESWPIVADDSEVVWVCGHRISDTFKITQNTKRILKLTITSAFVSTKEEQ